MSTYYLIPVGGTGTRVMRAVLYMCAAHCFDADTTIRVLCVDSDGSNGDLGDLKETWNLYNRLSEICTDIPKIEPVKFDAGESGVWSPLEKTNENLRSMLNYNQMDKGQELVDFFFTEAEQEKIYKGGFYGHTSIGSYFMAQSVLNEDGTYTSVWKKFFDGHEKGSKVFIVGSIFGGTGASAVPTIARIIKENPTTEDMELGATFVMPYFKPVKLDEDSKGILSIDWNTFSTKTKTALSFYIDQKYIDIESEEHIFDYLYFLGESKFMSVPDNDCGEFQKNKPHHIEMVAATSMFDFFKGEKTDSFLMKLMCIDDDEKIDKAFLNNTSPTKLYYNKLLKYLVFSILYVKYISVCLEENYSTDWKVDYYRAITENDNENLKKLCKKYISWFRALSLSTDKNGNISYKDYNRNIMLIDACSDAVKKLFTDEKLSYNIDGLIKKHNKYHLDELDNISSLSQENLFETGAEIIAAFSNIKCKDGNVKVLIKNMLDSINIK